VIQVKMHVRHAETFVRLLTLFPSSEVYGPYRHAGRHYLNWYARNEALQQVLGVLASCDFEALDQHAGERYRRLCSGLESEPNRTRRRRRRRSQRANGIGVVEALRLRLSATPIKSGPRVDGGTP
jgi:hypothetical protein